MSHDTKDALLDAAEALFAEQGVAQTSLRAITGAARANLAAVNYHFGSKEGLVKAVLDRRGAPLNRQRIVLLERAEAEAGPGGPQLEAVLEAFLAPALQLDDDGGREFARFLGRMHFESDAANMDLVVQTFETVAERFFLAIHRCVPELSPQELLWRFHFSVGAMAMSVVNREMLSQISRGLITEHGREQALERMISFLAAGFRAEPRSRDGDSTFEELLAAREAGALFR